MDEEQKINKLFEKIEKIEERIVRLRKILFQTFEIETRKGAAITELSNIHTDLSKKEIEFDKFMTEEMPKHVMTLEKLEDTKSTEILKTIRTKTKIPDQKEIGWLKKTEEDIKKWLDGTSPEHFEKSKDYQFLVENYDKYVKKLYEEWKDNKTATRLEKIARFVKDEEGKHLQAIRKEIDSIEKTDAKTFGEKLKGYIITLEKEGDKRIVRELKRADVVKYILNFKEAFDRMTWLVEKLKRDSVDPYWTEFRSYFEAGKIKTLIKELEERGDIPSARKLEEIEKRKGEPHDQTIKELEQWLRAMGSGEYIAKVEETSINKIDGIIEQRAKELSEQRAKNVHVLVGILKERVEKLEKTKENAAKEIAKEVQKRKEELENEREELKKEFEEHTRMLVLKLDLLTSEKSVTVIDRSTTTLTQKQEKMMQKTAETTGYHKQFLSKLEQMEKSNFTSADIQELMSIRRKIIEARMGTIDIEEAMLVSQEELQKETTKTFQTNQQIIEVYQAEKKHIDEIEQRMKITEKNSTTEVRIEEKPEDIAELVPT